MCGRVYTYNNDENIKFVSTCECGYPAYAENDEKEVNENGKY